MGQEFNETLKLLIVQGAVVVKFYIVSYYAYWVLMALLISAGFLTICGVVYRLGTRGQDLIAASRHLVGWKYSK